MIFADIRFQFAGDWHMEAKFMGVGGISILARIFGLSPPISF